MRKLFVHGFLLIHLILIASLVGAAEKEVIDTNNEYGGETIETIGDDFTYLRQFYDADLTKVKEEIVYTSEYPINNGLSKLVMHYFFDRLVKEEKIFKNDVVNNTKIAKTILYFDRFTGAKLKTENYFVSPYSGYNVIFKKNGAKDRIEWHYPDNIDGISKNIIYFDKNGLGVKVESYFTEKTIRENGYFKRIYFNEFGPDNYFRKMKQEWYYTFEYGKNNNGRRKKIEHFHYQPGSVVTVETNYFNEAGGRID